MTDTDEKSRIAIIYFDGKPSNWPVWEEKFLARGRRRGYKDILMGKATIPKDGDTIDANTADGKEKLKLRKLNELAYEELILSINADEGAGRVIFQLVKGCKTADLKDGDASLAWKKLVSKFAPKTAPNKLELKMEFQKCVLKSASEDPDEWITKLESIKVKLAEMNSTISDEDLLVHILNNLPKEYEIQQSKLEAQFGSTTSPLTIEDVRTELNLKFMRMNRALNGAEDEAEKALAAYAKKSKARCTNCGKLGHKSTVCWDIVGKPGTQEEKQGGKQEGTKTGIICHYCKKAGHIARNCYEKKNDEARKEAANTAMAGGDVVLSTGYTESDGNVWVGDSGATSHITNDDTGLYDVQVIDNPITVGDGREVTATKIGKLDMFVKQKDGKSTKVVMQEVQFVPDFQFKLFSLTAAMKNGCNISNDGMQLIVKKNGATIVFDHIMKKRSGFLLGVELVPILPDMVNVSMPSDEKVDFQTLYQ